MQMITTHRGTDFDALASVVAATILYPGAVPVLPRALNPNVKAFLSLHKDVFDMKTVKDIDYSRIKRLIIVDTNRWDRLEEGDILKEKKDIEVFIWDHHENDSDIATAWECREKTGANITIMVRELKKQNIALSPIQATLFLCGLYEDTGSLSFASTTADDAHTAGYLIENRADLNILRTFLQPAYGQQQKDILFTMLKTADRKRINNYNVSINCVEIHGHVSSLSLVVHMYREIVNVDVAFGLFVLSGGDKCIVIGRSNVPGINVGSIVRSMGGGGNDGAGSAMLKAVNPDAVRQWIEELLRGNQESSVHVEDIMSSPVFFVSLKTSMGEVAKILKEKGCTGLPVLDGEKLVGVISRRDFKKIRKESQLKSPVKAFMNMHPVTITPEKSPIHAARLMVKHDIGRLPVMDNGRLAGIISRSDAMRFFYDALPD